MIQHQSAGPSVINYVRGYGFVTLLTQLQSRLPSRTPAVFHKNTSKFSLDEVLVETELLLTLTHVPLSMPQWCINKNCLLTLGAHAQRGLQ